MLTYASYVTSIANLMPIESTTQANFVIMVPNMIDDAEQRLYRELDLLNTVVTASANMVAGNRGLTLPTTNGTFYVVNMMNIITPASQGNPELGTRNPLVESSRARLDFLYPSVTGSAVPQYFSFVTQTSIIVGPWPDQAYTMEVVGTIRPAPLAAGNATTLLSVYFPDLFIAASMVFVSGYMKNYGAAVDDPQQGVSWETHLQRLMQSAQVEEARKKLSTLGLRGSVVSSPVNEK